MVLMKNVQSIETLPLVVELFDQHLVWRFEPGLSDLGVVGSGPVENSLVALSMFFFYTGVLPEMHEYIVCMNRLQCNQNAVPPMEARL